MSKVFFAVICFLFFSYALGVPENLLVDWKNPSLVDLEKIQNFLNDEHKSLIFNEYGFRTDHIRSFQLFSPKLFTYSLQRKKGIDSTICITCYSSINSRYETDLYHIGLERLLKSLEKHGFSGDVLYRVGGWPNMEQGSLVVSDTPYAFKLCAFQEAAYLGYDQVLWLDLSVIALTDLSRVFEQIKKNGAYFRKSFHSFIEHSGRIITPQLAEVYNSSLSEIERIPHYATGVLGLDLKNTKVQNLLFDWYQFAKQKTPFQSSFPEQVPFSFLVNKYDLHGGLCPYDEIVFEGQIIQKESQFLIRY